MQNKAAPAMPRKRLILNLSLLFFENVITRTSTPVRSLRDGETMECTVLKRLYPAGEGSGYAGGIVSSAMDGEKVANLIAFL